MRSRSGCLTIAGASAVCALVATARVPPADAADPRVQQCLHAYEEGQRLRLEGRFVAARTQFVSCSAAHCPQDIAADCLTWMAEVQAATPSVVIDARRPDGTDAIDVGVWIDGTRVAQKLDGKAINVDPGQHLFRFEMAGMAPVERELLIRERELGRPIEVRFRPPEADPAPPPAPGATRSTPALVWVLGGAGLVGLGVFGYFGLHGNARKSDLDAQACKPNCDPSDVTAIKRDYLVANVGLAAGVVSLTVATWLLFSGSPQPAPPAVALDVGWQGGPSGGIRGRF